MKKSIKFILGTLLLGTFGLASCSTGSVFPDQQSGMSQDDFKVKGVTFSEEYRELQINEGFTLHALIEYVDGFEGGNELHKWVFDSNDSSVLEVMVDGLNATITAQRAGTAYVSYFAGIKKATCEIRVQEPAKPVDPEEEDDPTPEPPTPGPGPVEPSDFYIDLSVIERTLKPGESFRLIATTSEELGDNEVIEWVSSNTSVATVDNTGLVSALAVGETVISAKARGEEATCTLTVTSEGGGETGKDINVYFFIDYNNVDPTGEDVTCYHYLAKFKWYADRPLSESDEAQAVLSQFPVGSASTDAKALDPAFPHFIGWSSHTIIDDDSDLWDMEKDVIGPSLSFIYFYGIWTVK